VQGTCHRAAPTPSVPHVGWAGPPAVAPSSDVSNFLQELQEMNLLYRVGAIKQSNELIMPLALFGFLALCLRCAFLWNLASRGGGKRDQDRILLSLSFAAVMAGGSMPGASPPRIRLAEPGQLLGAQIPQPPASPSRIRALMIAMIGPPARPSGPPGGEVASPGQSGALLPVGIARGDTTALLDRKNGIPRIARDNTRTEPTMIVHRARSRTTLCWPAHAPGGDGLPVCAPARQGSRELELSPSHLCAPCVRSPRSTLREANPASQA
jgi:hypothetical protein